MGDQEARFQALATAGAVLVAFIGVVHEGVGSQLFPGAPAAFGPIVWHGMGLGCIIIGLLLTLGALKLIAFPVRLCAGVMAVAGLAGVILMAMAGGFHLFAFALFLAATATVFFHQKASSSSV